MAYNNYYPMSYQNYYPQVNNAFPNQNQQQTNNGMIWVVGENGADSYLVAPGQTVQLWDSTAPVFYLKSADAMGRPSKRVFDYTERNAVAEIPQNSPVSDFATKEDIYALQNKYAEIERKIAEIGGTHESVVQSNEQNKR